ncbi:MAG: LysR family transcriptional regulator, partial [Planctomycetota bacterium]
GDYRSLPALLTSGEVNTVVAFLREGAPKSCKVRVLRKSPWQVLRRRREAPIKNAKDFASRTHALVSPAGDLGGFVDDALAKSGLERRVTLAVTSFSLLGPLIAGSDLVSTSLTSLPKP